MVSYTRVTAKILTYTDFVVVYDSTKPTDATSYKISNKMSLKTPWGFLRLRPGKLPQIFLRLFNHATFDQPNLDIFSSKARSTRTSVK